jgi:hypothetical protein
MKKIENGYRLQKFCLLRKQQNKIDKAHPFSQRSYPHEGG